MAEPAVGSWDHLLTYAPELEAGMASDRFLVEEGLDLLAAYRLIRDPGLRASVLRLIIRIADAQPR